MLFAAAALSVGVGVYAAALTGSVRATLDAKARVFVGSDIAIPLQEASAVPPGVTGTTVAHSSRATADGSEVEMLGVDRATFARGAFWDASSPAAPWTISWRCSPRSPGRRRRPALATGPGVSDAPSIAPAWARAPRGGRRPSGHLVARPARSPASGPDPLVVVDRTVLEASGASIEYQLWAEGEQRARCWPP